MAVIEHIIISVFVILQESLHLSELIALHTASKKFKTLWRFIYQRSVHDLGNEHITNPLLVRYGKFTENASFHHYMSRFPNLTSLQTNYTSLDCFHDFQPTIKTMYVKSINFISSTLLMSSLTNLTFISQRDFFISSLAKLTNLRYLSIKKYAVFFDGINIQCLSNLETLKLPKCKAVFVTNMFPNSLRFLSIESFVGGFPLNCLPPNLETFILEEEIFKPLHFESFVGIPTSLVHLKIPIFHHSHIDRFRHQRYQLQSLRLSTTLATFIEYESLTKLIINGNSMYGQFNLFELPPMIQHLDMSISLYSLAAYVSTSLRILKLRHFHKYGHDHEFITIPPSVTHLRYDGHICQVSINKPYPNIIKLATIGSLQYPFNYKRHFANLQYFKLVPKIDLHYTQKQLDVATKVNTTSLTCLRFDHVNIERCLNYEFRFPSTLTELHLGYKTKNCLLPILPPNLFLLHIHNKLFDSIPTFCVIKRFATEKTVMDYHRIEISNASEMLKLYFL